MGTTASTPQELTAKQKDIEFLANRFPFSDSELERLYDLYHQERQESFLLDWNTAEEMQVVDREILKDLGNRWYRSAFCGRNPHEYLDGQSGAMDEFTRQTKVENFFEGIANSQRRGQATVCRVMFGLCEVQNDRVQAREFVSIGYQFARAIAYLQHQQFVHDDANDEILVAMSKSIINRAKMLRNRNKIMYNKPSEDPELEQGWIEIDDVLEWVDHNAPAFATILPTFVHYWLFPNDPLPPTRTAFDFPRAEDSVFFQKSSALLFALASLSRSLGGPYYRLFTSASDGLSFNRLQNALLGYSGPTLLLIRATTGGIFGAFTGSPWKEAKDFYGNSDIFLFQMSPSTAVYRPVSGGAGNYMYCNSNARSRGYDQQAHGIGFGGTTDQPRLFISESFDECYAGTQDTTFENGSLLARTDSGTPQKYFEIDCIEVWGVGGEEIVEQALGARKKARDVKNQHIQRARKVDKAAFLDDLRSGVIESKAFQHRQQVDGRADADAEQ